MSKAFSLLCTSHGIALLDAVTDWRSLWQSHSVDLPEHGANAQGWFNGAMPNDFAAGVTLAGTGFERCDTWLAPGHVQVQLGAPLAEIDHSAPGGPVLRMHPVLIAKLQQWHENELIISGMGGNEYLTHLFRTAPDYDIVLDGFPVTPGVPILPLEVAHGMMERWVAPLVTTLTALRVMSTKRVVHMLPPPPLEDIASMPYTEGFGAAIQKYGFVADSLRLKWYRLYCDMIIARTRSMNIDVITPPRGAMTPEGFLRKDYAEGLTHGNKAYGVLLARKIFQNEE